MIHLRDPFIVVHNNHYIMYGTTGDYGTPFQGKNVLAYISDDLINWGTPIVVFQRPNNFWADSHFWAPEVYAYHARWYMAITFTGWKGANSYQDIKRGTQLLVSESPLGPFMPYHNETITPFDKKCLDGTLYLNSPESAYLIYCEEWQSIRDGTFVLQKLSSNLKDRIGESTQIFSASDIPWAKPYQNNDYVSDGPYIFETETNLFLLISSYTKNQTYAIGFARSITKKIEGPWQLSESPLYELDGGHGMIFRSLKGNHILAIHSPNTAKKERPLFLPIREKGQTLELIN